MYVLCIYIWILTIIDNHNGTVRIIVISWSMSMIRDIKISVRFCFEERVIFILCLKYININIYE